MVPVGRLTIVRTFAKSELIRAMSFVAIPGLIGPMLGPIAGGLIVGYFHWRRHLLRQPSDRPHRFVPGLPAPARLSRKVRSPRCGRPHPLWLRHRAAVVCAGGIRRTYAERCAKSLGLLAISILLLAGYGLHAAKTAFPLLALSLFRIRTFRAAVSGSFFTRLGIGGIPFILPLLYQVGLGFYSDSIRSADDAAGDCRHEPEDDYAADSDPLWLPRRIDFQHRDPRSAHSALRNHRRGHAGSGLSSRRRSASGSSARCNIPA